MKPPARDRLVDLFFLGRGHRNAWKHSAPSVRSAHFDPELLYLFTVRHPVSWALALRRRPYNLPPVTAASFGTFLDTAFRLNHRDGLKRLRLRPIEIWNAKVASCRALIEALTARSAAHVLIRFEDFTADQRRTFTAIAPHLRGAATDPAIVERSTKNDAGKTAAYYADYYSRELWRDEIAAADLARIARDADPGLCRWLGYTV